MPLKRRCQLSARRFHHPNIGSRISVPSRSIEGRLSRHVHWCGTHPRKGQRCGRHSLNRITRPSPDSKANCFSFSFFMFLALEEFHLTAFPWKTLSSLPMEKLHFFARLKRWLFTENVLLSGPPRTMRGTLRLHYTSPPWLETPRIPCLVGWLFALIYARKRCFITVAHHHIYLLWFLI